ncbi:MAG: hypothetical protein M1823_000432 [Watsoniomyces obsoletus]|nr:MAG: hypothetical protein M1823_000432 [Watsoniomyces obsoletus]
MQLPYVQLMGLIAVLAAPVMAVPVATPDLTAREPQSTSGKSLPGNIIKAAVVGASKTSGGDVEKRDAQTGPASDALKKRDPIFLGANLGLDLLGGREDDSAGEDRKGGEDIGLPLKKRDPLLLDVDLDLGLGGEEGENGDEDIGLPLKKRDPILLDVDLDLGLGGEGDVVVPQVLKL